MYRLAAKTMSLRSRVAAVSILAPSTGSPTRRAAPLSERHISARRWMQRTTRPSGVPDSPASSEKGCGGSRVGTECGRRGNLSPTSHPQNPNNSPCPGPTRTQPRRAQNSAPPQIPPLSGSGHRPPGPHQSAWPQPGHVPLPADGEGEAQTLPSFSRSGEALVKEVGIPAFRGT